MYCKNCKNEIKEGCAFCTNCGKTIQNNEIEENINNKISLTKINKIVIAIVIVILIVIGSIVYFNKNNDVKKEQETSNINEIAQMEIGTYYQCTNAGSEGYIIFNSDVDFEMKIGDYGSEYSIRKGSYITEGNTITLDVSYDSSYLMPPTDEMDPSFEKYTIKLNIIKEDMLEYTNDSDVSYIFKKSSIPNVEKSSEEKVYITQDSDVSPTGKEFIGEFSDSLTEIFNNEGRYYKTSIENIEQYNIELLFNDKKIEETIYYYNSKNNKIIGSKETINYINYYKKILENSDTTLIKELDIFMTGATDVFLNAHNENSSEEALNRINKYDTYILNNFSNLENKIFEYGNYTFKYRTLGDIVYVITEYKNNNNKMEVLLLAYDENKDPEQEIKNWYDKVVTLNEKEENEVTATNFIDEINSKYPEYKSVICSNDYGEYWLLDKEGKKIYFSNLKSFENALKICNEEDEDVVFWKDMNDEQKKKFSKELLISKCEKENIGSEYIEGIKKNIIKQEILTENNNLTYIVMSLTPKRANGQTVYHYIDTYILQIISDDNLAKWKGYDYVEYIYNNTYYIKCNRLDSVGSSSYSSSSTSNVNDISQEDLNKGIQKATEKVNAYLNKN